MRLKKKKSYIIETEKKPEMLIEMEKENTGFVEGFISHYLLR